MPTPSRQLLIVDDEPTVSAAIALFLADEFEVQAADSAADAFGLLDSLERLDTAVVDVRMPGLRGIEFASMLADLRPDLAIVVMSGLERPRDGELPGRVPFLQKPFFPDELLGTIAEARRRRDAVDGVPTD